MNFKEGMETSQNPAVQLIAVATDKVKMESSCARAVKQMQTFNLLKISFFYFYFFAQTIFFNLLNII